VRERVFVCGRHLLDVDRVDLVPIALRRDQRLSQSGIVDPGSPDGVAVAIVTFAPSFSAGTETLTRTASWLAKHIDLHSHAASAGSPTAE
jgi:hypothetical protein